MTRGRRILLIAAAIVAAVTVIGVVVAAAAGAPLDRTVVIHWGLDGQPNGWGPAWTYPLLIGATGGFLAVLLLVFGLIRYPAARAAATPPALPLREGEIAVWTGTVPMPRWLLVLVIALGVLIAALGVVLVATLGWRGLPAFIGPVVILLALAVSGDYRATAGPTGFTARSVLGWPAFRIPVSDIARVSIVEVQAMRDFGGWGLRWVPAGPGGGSRWGIVSRQGEGLEVVRRDGRSLVVTVGDAATAAAVLEAYAARA